MTAPKNLHAVQLFGVVPAALAGRRFVAGGPPATAVSFGNLALVIRDVDSAQWNPQALEARRSDHDWLAHEAAIHQRVLERAMHAGPVVPARFWTIFEGRDALDDAVQSNSERWRKALARLAGKQEYCLHVYAGPHLASHHEPYVTRVIPCAVQAQSFEGAHAEHLGALWKACSALASASRRIEPLPNGHYVFGATYLLRRSGLREFRAALMRFAVAAREIGLTYYLDGPHPPFTFV